MEIKSGLDIGWRIYLIKKNDASLNSENSNNNVDRISTVNEHNFDNYFNFEIKNSIYLRIKSPIYSISKKIIRNKVGNTPYSSLIHENNELLVSDVRNILIT